ncbi:MAG: tripartite tricarboxylate transporter substrate binding protein [Xanthobacteraceae bacterium]
MRLARRTFLGLTAGAALLPKPPMAWALDYPTRPVHIIVAFPAGNASDTIARLAAQGLLERLGQSFIIENRPGAGGNIGAELVARAHPDGYTLLVASGVNAVNATLYEKLNFNFMRDIAPVASICRVPDVMVVDPSVPAKTVPEFIAYAKANPRKINMASAGNGSASHLAGELFKLMTGVDLVHVPYRGSFIPDLLGGQVQVTFAPIPVAIAYIRTGKLRALAVTGTARSKALPDIPTVAESVPGYEASAWYGIGAPEKTPAKIIDQLNKEIGACLADPKIMARLSDLGAIPMSMTSEEFGKFIAAETEKWAKVIRAADIKPE